MICKMICDVHVKPTHPKGQFHRDGILFTREPQRVEMTPALEREAAKGEKSVLVFVEVGDPSDTALAPIPEPETSGDPLEEMTLAELRAKAKTIGLTLPPSTKKPEVLDAIQGKLAEPETA